MTENHSAATDPLWMASGWKIAVDVSFHFCVSNPNLPIQ